MCKIFVVIFLWIAITAALPAQLDQDTKDILKSIREQANYRIPFSLELEPPPVGTGKLVSKQFKDAVVFPDEVTRDSYGNLVPPFDIPNNDFPSNTNKPKVVINSGLKFPIPSYASGITDIKKPSSDLVPPSSKTDLNIAKGRAHIDPPATDLLPPLSSGNYNFPGISQNARFNEITESQQIYQSTKSSAINQQTIQTDRPDTTIPSKIFLPPFTTSKSGIDENKFPTFAQTQSPPLQRNPINFNQGIDIPTTNIQTITTPSPIDSTTPNPNKYTGGFGFGFDTTPIKKFDTTYSGSPSTVSFSKYTGGFGGAPGILGEQKSPGYGVKPTKSITTTSKPALSGGQKYTGGFGGPPGFLTPYDGKNSKAR